ncbi:MULTISPECIES: co-chaperone DjlA [Aeromonas]|uniref:Co-chaperone protein DjlA n=1 Tax=Aeromonas caviae TaxID=648 RepID=A0AA37FU87_AERCA|nr:MULTISPECIES: co-chaperone DjlA [Aeromonas]AUZ78736.1 co-chaperone DjlA [Aeromonas sp. ASNIH1]MBL0586040.1 co-chaperone DjlA [Aeromonas caviae]GJA17982.1 co-chaperone protein DjlA [Aeromonas caviae]GJA26941.1 co-chaperone protein DjlA [Aeromonas caviae]GJA62588.1 co-chaperone protein DjlA [Aeromonas caviae]
MRIWGKVLGTFFGFLLGNIFGALLGLWIGHRFDRGMGMSFRRAPTQQQQAVFFHATFAVMGHIAKASGQVTEQEIRVASNLMDRMRLSGEQRVRAQESFRQGKESGFPLRETLAEFRRASLGQRDILRFFLEVQLQAAFADGRVEADERAILQTIADELGFSQIELARILAMAEAQMNFFHRQQQGGQGQQRQAPTKDRLKDAYQLLGVSEGDSDQEIKRAYRKEMSKHHPDKLAAKGLPPEMMEMAKEKTQEIQQAWEWIREARGIR